MHNEDDAGKGNTTDRQQHSRSIALSIRSLPDPRQMDSSAAAAPAAVDAPDADSAAAAAAAPAAASSASSSKASKNARKKANRKAKAKAASAITSALLAEANALTHATVMGRWFPAFARKGRFRFYYAASTDLSAPVLDWAFLLTKINMQRMYARTAGWGWNDKQKRAETEHADARYIIVTQVEEEEERRETKTGGDAAVASAAASSSAAADSAAAAASAAPVASAAAASSSSSSDGLPAIEGSPVAFCSFRYTLGDIDAAPILYVYELQLESAVQRAGLGRFVMSLVELLAWRAQMLRVVLTVFQSNTPALKLYRDRLHYEMDESDPSLFEVPPEKHTILCKKSKKITEVSQIVLPLVPSDVIAAAVSVPAASAPPA